mmetsp:Transcript_27859/g.32498  ORF Transcript_27859/g.32498 Transcript_27859/m.32498 type:complete len:262 (-) Transcript_27859:85-870(-)
MTSRDVIIYLSTEDSTGSLTSDLQNINITTPKLSSQVLPKSDVPLSTITVHIEDISIYNPLSLASLIPHLRQDGKGRIIIQFMPSDADASSIHTSITLAGLTPQSETSNEDHSTRTITAIYNNKKKSSKGTIGIKRNYDQKNTVKINIGDLTEDDDLMINEDDLLSSSANEIINPPAEVDMAERKKQLDDCGGRKACDDCTCGRKEMEEHGGNEKDNNNSKSACGNCAKGDAFRCAGCPFLGKPAFKEGDEHLVLDLTDDL